MNEMQFIVDNLEELCIITIIVTACVNSVLNALTKTIRAIKRKKPVKKEDKK